MKMEKGFIFIKILLKNLKKFTRKVKVQSIIKIIKKNSKKKTRNIFFENWGTTLKT